MTSLPLALFGPLQAMVDVFEWVLLRIYDLVGSWGLSIILLTVVVRALLIPLTVKQFKSMRSLQQHMPEMKALQEKYKDDKQRLNQEMMKFYSENSINPLASCLPLIAQLPVFISLFYMLRLDLKTDICGEGIPPGRNLEDITCDQVQPGSADFLFIPDLTAKGTGWVLAVLIVGYVGSQLLSSLLTPATADKNQRYIMLALPFVFVAFIWNFPTGLLVYWITTNLWTVGQSYLIRRNSPPLPVPDYGKDKKGKGAKGSVKAPAAGEPVAAGAAAASGSGSAARAIAPPPPPRSKKKKKTGRRR